MPVLIHNAGEPDERSYALGAETVTVGRSEECGVSVPHKSLSRIHARLDSLGGRFVVVDLRSKNGTWVNGIRVKRKELRSGDVVTFGDLAFTFALDEGERTPSRDGDIDEGDPRPTAVLPLTELAIETFLDLEGGQAVRVKRGNVAANTHDKLDILLEVSRLLSGSAGVDALLEKILDLVFRLFDVDRGAILLIDEETGVLTPKVVKSTRAPAAPGETIYSQNIVDYVAGRSVAALFSDAALDPRLDPTESIIHQAIRSSMCVPLKPKNAVVGVLYVDNLSVPNRFSERDLEFLVAFASQAAIAIENSVLYRRIERETMTRMQTIMEEKLAALGSVVAGIAHEIRNPLNFITNFADLSAGLVTEVSTSLGEQRGNIEEGDLEDMREGLEMLSDNVAKIQAHGRRANAIITSMLQHARGSSSAREEADINVLVAEGVSLSAERALAAGFHFEVESDYAEGLASMGVMRGDLIRVFVNIVDNAIHAMIAKKKTRGEGYSPKLSVRTADVAGQVEVRIRDNGVGIAPEIAGKVFDPFFTTKSAGEGMGLGLSLSHDIVVQGHQGTMRMESTLGEHTTFIVTLPQRGSSSRR